jgi:hypothetical protein
MKNSVKVVFLFLIVLTFLAGCGGSLPSSSTGGAAASPSATSARPPASSTVTSATPVSTAQTAFRVASVQMAVSPASIAGQSCGAELTVTYTATFHVVPDQGTHTVQFAYTINNGRSEQLASLQFLPGQATKTFSFSWHGSLPLDHTAPGLGGVLVTSPNQLISTPVKPAGLCTPAPFRVTSVTMSVNPGTIAGLHCGTNLTVTYTATFHIAPESMGGVIKFGYTVDNGRSGGDNTQTLIVGPGTTTQTYSFTWSGALPADHTFPEPGGVLVSSPNVVRSPLVGPSGQCS